MLTEMDSATAHRTKPLGPSRAVYLDHHASTPVDPRVAQLVYEVMTEHFGNPNSVDHQFGEEAARLIDRSRAQVARLIGAEDEDVRFTSGSTEAIRLAIAYASERRAGKVLKIAASRVEHAAVLDALAAASARGLAETTWIEVDDKCRVDLASIERCLEAGAELVCLMAANNEVGTTQPVETAARLTRLFGAEILVDATQAAGRLDLRTQDWGIDYLVLSGHKMYGPKGIGALISPGVGAAPPPTLYAFHDATPNTPGIAGLGEACRLRVAEMGVDEPRITALRDELEARLKAGVPGLVVNGDPDARLSNNLHVSAPRILNDAVVAQLRYDVAISTGAACASGADAPSHVLRAMGLAPWRQDGALRISLGRFTTAGEIERAAAAIIAAIRSVQASLQEHP